MNISDILFFKKLKDFDFSLSQYDKRLNTILRNTHNLTIKSVILKLITDLQKSLEEYKNNNAIAQDSKQNVRKCFFHIIMPCCNCSKFIDRALKSIIDQTYSDYIISIVDDVSTDNIKQTLKKYLKNNKIKISYLTKKVFGGGARNIALNDDSISSKYTMFLDADDYFSDNTVLLKIYEKLQKSKFLTEFLKLGYILNKNSEQKPKIFNKNNMLYFEASWTVCIKTEKSKRFKEQRYRFNDVIWYLTTFDSCSKLDVLEYPVVVYNIDENKNSVLHGEKNKLWLESLILLVEDLAHTRLLKKDTNILKNRIINRRLKEYNEYKKTLKFS